MARHGYLLVALIATKTANGLKIITNEETVMHEVDLKQDEKVVTLVIDCSSIEDANRLYLLLEQIFLDDKEQEENTIVCLN